MKSFTAAVPSASWTHSKFMPTVWVSQPVLDEADTSWACVCVCVCGCAYMLLLLKWVEGGRVGCRASIPSAFSSVAARKLCQQGRTKLLRASAALLIELKVDLRWIMSVELGLSSQSRFAYLNVCSIIKNPGLLFTSLTRDPAKSLFCLKHTEVPKMIK